jgi:hypothetical protein
VEFFLLRLPDSDEAEEHGSHHHRLGYMTKKNKTRKKALSEEEIDNLVESQADDDEAWDEPILVSGRRQASVSLPSDLAARAAFLAKLHKEQ